MGIDTLLDLIDRFDVPTLAVLTWLWMRGNRLANARAMAEQQAAFIEAMSSIKTELAGHSANLLAQTSALKVQTAAFGEHVLQDKADNESISKAISSECGKIHGRIDVLAKEVHLLQGAANA